MAIEKAFFRQVMGRFATGVTVVTTRSQQVLGGLTVNSFCSVSLNPPLVLVCIDNNCSTLALLRESKIFAVNMLNNEQKEYSRCFATNSQGRFDKFYNVTYHTAVTGAPVLDDVLAFIDARIIAEYPGGDHAIFIGQVEAMGTAGEIGYVNNEGQELPTEDESQQAGSVQTALEGEPLLYFEGQYRHMTTLYRKPSIIGARTDHVEEAAGGR